MLLSALLLAGCASVTPMQTASTVAPGGYRLGGSTAIAPWCSVSLDPPRNCNLVPSGLPLPELRASARHGLSPGLDLGASLQLAAVAGSRAISSRAGLYLDLKQELWERSLEASRQLLSLAPGVGFGASRAGEGSVASVDLVAPLYFGHQRGRVEWVAGARLVERLTAADADGDGRRTSFWGTEAGLWGGVYAVLGEHRAGSETGPSRIGLELSYQSDLTRPGGGLFLLAAGLFMDVAPPAR